MNIMKTLGALSLVAVLALSTTGCGSDSKTTSFTQVKDMKAAEKQKQLKAVLTTYADIAYDTYNDSLTDAIALQTAINNFTADPTEAKLELAKTSWKASRESYGQSEIFRLSNGPIDAEDGWVEVAYGALEGQINAWPLDENMIDYTEDADGNHTTGNIIDSRGEFTPSGDDATAVNIDNINVETLTALDGNGGEANVATGYHAIEFLLWGQDQDYASFINDNVTKGARKAGERGISDYTSDGDAQRRKDYLNAATTKLVDDLTIVRNAWNKTQTGDSGKYRKAFLGELTGDANISGEDALKGLLSGMGIFIKSELANERMRVAVLTPSEEDEHSCFSDNTHRDIVLNYGGFVNVLQGKYNGKTYSPSMQSLLSEDRQKSINDMIKSIDAKVAIIDEQAKNIEHFDYQIKKTSANRANVRAVVTELRALGDEIILVGKEYGIDLTQDDVTDPGESDIPSS